MKNILNEQGSTDWNCEVDASTGGCNCVPNLVGCGQYPGQAECQANVNPNTGAGCPAPEPCCATSNCGINPGPDCWYCHGGDFSSGIQTFIYSPSHSNPAQIGYPTGGICHQFSEGGQINQNNMLNNWLPSHGGTVQQGGSIVVWEDNASCLDAGCGPNPPVGWTPPPKILPYDIGQVADMEADMEVHMDIDNEKGIMSKKENLKEELNRMRKLF